MVVFINSGEEGVCTFLVYILSPPVSFHLSHFFHLLSNHLLMCPTPPDTSNMSHGEMDAEDTATPIS